MRETWGLEGLIWDDLAMLRMEEGDLDGAESALANEYRLWVLFRTPNPEYLDLRIAQLRLLQGKAGESLSWLKRAEIHSRKSPGSMMPHEREHDVALALEAARSGAGEALQAARRAWRWSAEWRQEALPAQSAQMVADVTQAELAGIYAEATGGGGRHRRMYSWRWREPSGEPAIRDSEPAGDERAAGAGARRVLMEWRSRTARWLNGGGGGEEPKEIGVLRARLAEIEIGAGLPVAVAEQMETRMWC